MPDQRRLPEYHCYTDCLHCPFRSSEHVPGHARGSRHTDHHILLVVTGTGVELRCNAKWHKRKTTQQLLEQTESSWRAHYALLFGAKAQPPLAQHAAPFTLGPLARQRFHALRKELLS